MDGATASPHRSGMEEEDVLIGLGRRICVLRRGMGLSQERFALQAGLDRTYYAAIERGERNPSVKQLAKIAAALDMRIAALFADEDIDG